MADCKSPARRRPIVWTVAGAAGAFLVCGPAAAQLAARSPPPKAVGAGDPTCLIPARLLAPGITQTGDLGTTASALSNGGPLNVYDFDVAEDDYIRVAVMPTTSNGIDAKPPSARRVTLSAGQCKGDGYLRVRAVGSRVEDVYHLGVSGLTPGRYRMRVSSLSGVPTTYELKSERIHPTPPPDAKPIDFDDSVSGQLRDNTRRRALAGERYDLYAFHLGKDRRVRLTAKTASEDLKVEIGEARPGVSSFWSDYFSVTRASADSPEGQAVFAALHEGDYLIRVSSGVEGPIDYELQLARAAPAPEPPKPITIRRGDHISGRLEFRDAMVILYDEGDVEETFRPYKLYALSGRAGETAVVTLQGNDFDANLEAGLLTVLPPRFVAAEENDDVEGGDSKQKYKPSRLELKFVSSGTVVLRASSTDDGAFGAYTLTVK